MVITMIAMVTDPKIMVTCFMWLVIDSSGKMVADPQNMVTFIV